MGIQRVTCSDGRSSADPLGQSGSRLGGGLPGGLPFPCSQVLAWLQAPLAGDRSRGVSKSWVCLEPASILPGSSPPQPPQDVSTGVPNHSWPDVPLLEGSLAQRAAGTEPG